MSDAEELVKRIRDGDFSNLNEASDMIERLTAENATLRKDAEQSASMSSILSIYEVERLRRIIGYIAAELMIAGDKRTFPEIVETASKATSFESGDEIFSACSLCDTHAECASEGRCLSTFTR